MAADTQAAKTAQLNVVLDGTWAIVPTVNTAGIITGVQIYSPACGHPHGATFLNRPGPVDSFDWPSPSTFYMLDDHGLCLNIHRAPGTSYGMTPGGIDPSVNHMVATGRPMAGNWDLVISIPAGPDAWISSATVDPKALDPAGNKVPCYSGKDAPAGKVSALQTLVFNNVTSVELCGAPAKLQELLSSWTGTGSLVFEGEVPYIPTLQHERAAVAALASLAGLDLALDYPLPSSASAPSTYAIRPRIDGQANCSHAIILKPPPAAGATNCC
jgi:hypothetical protein